ncbi:hypothetical protein J6590_005158 [Homalodisca vitripennis]|nr:hypothetical protein J6590_005158 [Homalodisca vitripennis]
MTTVSIIVITPVNHVTLAGSRHECGRLSRAPVRGDDRFPPVVVESLYASARLGARVCVMEPPCRRHLWRNGGVLAHALNRLLRIAKQDKASKLPNIKVGNLT